MFEETEMFGVGYEAEMFMPEKIVLRIAASSRGEGLDSDMSPLFGRAPYFIIVESDGREVLGIRPLPNVAAEQEICPGASAAKILAHENVNVLITMSMDRNSFEILKNNGITLYSGVAGRIEDNILLYLRSKLPEIKDRWGIGKDNASAEKVLEKKEGGKKRTKSAHGGQPRTLSAFETEQPRLKFSNTRTKSAHGGQPRTLSAFETEQPRLKFSNTIKKKIPKRKPAKHKPKKKRR